MIEPRKIPDPGWLSLYTKQTPIAELARKLPGRRLVSLNPHLDLEWMEEACRQTRKDGAAGVDGMTWEEYSRTLPPAGAISRLRARREARCRTYCKPVRWARRNRRQGFADRTVAMLTKPGHGAAFRGIESIGRTDRPR